MTQIDGDKLWIKVVFAKKRGGFTKLIEAMTEFGFELNDTSVTTSNGAMLVSSWVTVSTGKTSQTKYSSVVIIIHLHAGSKVALHNCTVHNRHR